MSYAAPSIPRVLVNRAAGRGIPSVSWRHSQAVFAPAGFGWSGLFFGVRRSHVLTLRRSLPAIKSGRAGVSPHETVYGRTA